MWPETPPDLIRLQRELASGRPAPWRAAGPRPLVAGCFVWFERGGSGAGRAGKRGWAGAALMRAGRHLAGTTAVRGRAGGAYQPGLLALREGRLLEAAVRALPGKPEVVISARGSARPLIVHPGWRTDLDTVVCVARAAEEPGLR